MTNAEFVGTASQLLRLSLGIMFFAHAWLKIKVFTPAGSAKYFESLGVPGSLAYVTMAADIAGGAQLILGIETRWVALLLVPLVLGTIVLVHAEDAFDPAGELAEHLLGLEPRKPPHLLAQHGDLRRAEQVGENEESVALELRELGRGQFHPLSPSEAVRPSVAAGYLSSQIVARSWLT
jgi:uncharacterized membrane protein YphA (DoxX/SURF4 family)